MRRLIDADALKYEPLPKGDRNYRTYNLDDAYDDGYDDAFTDIRNAPTIDAVPVRHGKWEYGEDESGYDGYYCSKCFGHVRWYGKVGEQSINFIKKYNYCPNCGARMDEE